MALTNPIIRPDQAHAARILVQVSVDYLGKKTGFDIDTIDGFENDRIQLEESQQDRLRTVLEDLGAVFIPEDEAGGYGVRLKFNSRKVRSIDRWEGEGGPVHTDTV